MPQYNLLTGPIPKELCNAVSLTELDLNSNFLTGTIEGTLVMCTNLTQLVLVDNQIFGPINLSYPRDLQPWISYNAWFFLITISLG